MQPFKITLPGGKVVTGLHCLPSATTSSSPKKQHNQKPLIVALHGGTYTARYFDVDADHSASVVSEALGVPIVAVNRPGYDETTAVASTADSSYAQDFGVWLHQDALPALWSEFGGERSGRNCIVLHAHSLGTTGAVIAASLHATTSPSPYPLGGISFSGFGTQPAGPRYRPPPAPGAPPPTVVRFPPEVKDSMMLQRGHAHPEMYKYTEELNHDMPADEIGSLERVWFPRWRDEWAGNLMVPVMVGIGGHDLMWKGTQEHLHDITSAFVRSERVDGSIVGGAPHNMEMSYWAKGWYARVFGFALECAVTYAHK